MGKINFNWGEFFRIFLGVTSAGIGVAIVSTYGGGLLPLILGFVFIGIGAAIILAN